MLWSQKIDVVDMDSKKRWMSAAVLSFLGDTNGVDFGVGLDVGGTKGGEAFKQGGGLEKNVRQNLAVEVESKKVHETGRRESPEFLDQTVLHEISRRIQP